MSTLGSLTVGGSPVSELSRTRDFTAGRSQFHNNWREICYEAEGRTSRPTFIESDHRTQEHQIDMTNFLFDDGMGTFGNEEPTKQSTIILSVNDYCLFPFRGRTHGAPRRVALEHSSHFGEQSSSLESEAWGELRGSHPGNALGQTRHKSGAKEQPADRTHPPIHMWELANGHRKQCKHPSETISGLECSGNLSSHLTQ
jgi:hypothetical protein